MNEQLAEIISYLARQGIGIRLQAIELQIHTHDDVEILVPELHGELLPQGEKPTWNFDKFFADAKRKLNTEEFTALERLYQFSARNKLTWGTGVTYGSFSLHVDRISKKSIYTVTSNGQVVINFGQLNDSPAAIEFRDELKRQLERIQGFEIPENFQARFFCIPANKWVPVADEFIQVVDGLLADKTS